MFNLVFAEPQYTMTLVHFVHGVVRSLMVLVAASLAPKEWRGTVLLMGLALVPY